MTQARAVAVVAVLTLGCSDDVRGPFDLDNIEVPTDTCLTVIHESLDIGLTVHDYVADAPGSTGGWALVTIDNGVGVPELALVRIPASPDEPELAPIELGFSSLASVRVDLRGGAVPGELWMLQDSGTSATLNKFAPGIGELVSNESIANFPVLDGGSGCPDSYERQLLLIEGRPFILALPNCSDSPALELQLLELDPDTVLFTGSWLLDFNPCTDDPECATYQYTIAPIRGGESTHVPDAERVALGFSQVRNFGDAATSSDVSLLELRLTTGAPSARLVTFRQVWITPTTLSPVELAQDPFSVQLHVRNGGSQEDAALLRFDAIGELYIQIKTPQLLPLGGRGRLVQLATQSAMVDVRDHKLEVVPLADVTAWPVWDPRVMVELDDLVGLQPAGGGQLLLHREYAPPQVVQLRCID